MKPINFVTYAKFEKATVSNNHYVIEVIASDDQTDFHKDRMSLEGLEYMKSQFNSSGLPLTDGHKTSFGFGRSISADILKVEKEGNSYHELSVSIELDMEYPQARTLFKEISEGTCIRQLSIGGHLDLSSGNPVTIEMDNQGNMVRTIHKVRLNHLAVTRANDAANARTRFASAVMKELENSVEKGSIQLTELQTMMTPQTFGVAPKDLKQAVLGVLQNLFTTADSHEGDTDMRNKKKVSKKKISKAVDPNTPNQDKLQEEAKEEDKEPASEVKEPEVEVKEPEVEVKEPEVKEELEVDEKGTEEEPKTELVSDEDEDSETSEEEKSKSISEEMQSIKSNLKSLQDKINGNKEKEGEGKEEASEEIAEDKKEDVSASEDTKEMTSDASAEEVSSEEADVNKEKLYKANLGEKVLFTDVDGNEFVGTIQAIRFDDNGVQVFDLNVNGDLVEGVSSDAISVLTLADMPQPDQNQGVDAPQGDNQAVMEGDTVSFTDDQGNELTGVVSRVLANDGVLEVTLPDGSLVFVPIDMATVVKDKEADAVEEVKEDAKDEAKEEVTEKEKEKSSPKKPSNVKTVSKDIIVTDKLLLKAKNIESLLKGVKGKRVNKSIAGFIEKCRYAIAECLVKSKHNSELAETIFANGIEKEFEKDFDEKGLVSKSLSNLDDKINLLLQKVTETRNNAVEDLEKELGSTVGAITSVHEELEKTQNRLEKLENVSGVSQSVSGNGRGSFEKQKQQGSIWSGVLTPCIKSAKSIY